MQKAHALYVIIVTALLGCSSPSLVSAFSYDDAQCFSESPTLVRQEGRYKLQWRYGSSGFYFQPNSSVVNGELHFVIQAMTSTGNQRGKRGSIPIKNADQIQALLGKGAYWVEPNGKKIRIKIIDQPPA